jgi:uncharacterized membrane protein
VLLLAVALVGGLVPAIARMDRQLLGVVVFLGVVLLDERRSGLFLLGFAAVVTGSCWPTGRAGGPDP